MALETPPAAPAAATVVAPAPVAAPEVVAPAPVVQVAPAQVPTAYPPDVVPVPKHLYEELQGYKASVAKMEADRQAAESAAKQAALQAQLDKGQFKEAIDQIRKTAEETAASERSQRALAEDRAKKYALKGELSSALGNGNLVTGGAEQLYQLWQNQFLVEPAGDGFSVRTSGFQSASEYVASQLAKPEYSHFVRSSTPGGVGPNPGAQTTAPTAQPVVVAPIAPAQPKTFGEAIILQMAEMQKGQPVDPRMNTGVAMGLNARSIHRQA